MTREPAVAQASAEAVVTCRLIGAKFPPSIQMRINGPP